MFVTLDHDSAGPTDWCISTEEMLRQSEDSSVAAEPASAELTKTNQPGSARRDLLELSVGYTLAMATIWTVNPTQRVLYWLAFVLIVAPSWARRYARKPLSLGPKGLPQPLWAAGFPLLLSPAPFP